MSALARVEDEWHGDIPVARVAGEIDASNVRDIGERLRSLVSNRSFALVVDLSPTSYLDSAGINLLFAVGQELSTRQQRLYLVVAEGSPVTRMVTLTGLHRSFPTHTSVDDALAAA
jgi:anti-sigma B factor antagonist